MRTAKQLYEEIEDLYGGLWLDSEPYKELMRRLKKKTVKVLQEEGYKVPNWKKPTKKGK